jgi:hypothetical protein
MQALLMPLANTLEAHALAWQRTAWTLMPVLTDRLWLFSREVEIALAPRQLRIVRYRALAELTLEGSLAVQSVDAAAVRRAQHTDKLLLAEFVGPRVVYRLWAHVACPEDLAIEASHELTIDGATVLRCSHVGISGAQSTLFLDALQAAKRALAQ